MDSMSAFARGEANRGKELMVFDWDKAARLIVESGAQRAGAGLSGDWDWTGGPIFENGGPVEEYTYLASTWATPELTLDGGMPVPCFVMESECDWDSDTKWPASASEILNAR